MHVSTYRDVDVVALEQDDEVTVMLELSAPAPASAAPRPPAAVQVVLDRSGSIHGGRLDATSLARRRSLTCGARSLAASAGAPRRAEDAAP